MGKPVVQTSVSPAAIAQQIDCQCISTCVDTCVRKATLRVQLAASKKPASIAKTAALNYKGVKRF